MATDSITYFGYGSLVNRDTRPASETAFNARLYGWQRFWGHRIPIQDCPKGSMRGCCSVTVQRITSQTRVTTGAFVDGVVVTVPLSELPALDQRERGYDRVAIPCAAFELQHSVDADVIHVYVSQPSNFGPADEAHPILQSYIDVVLGGYFDVFGEAGLQQFVDDTIGWDGVIENDREAPRYPRAVSLPNRQLEQFDALIEARRLRGRE